MNDSAAAVEEVMMAEAEKLSKSWHKLQVYEAQVQRCYPQVCYLHLNDLSSQWFWRRVQRIGSVEMNHCLSSELL